MAINTYATLQSSISDWLNRSDLTSAIESFISLAEAQMNRTIRHRDMIERAQATIDSEYAGGKPQCYTHVGDEIQVYPVPDSTSYTAELVYYAKIPPLSDSNTSNWLLAAHPDIYLYGALMQSAPYLVDDQRLGVWAGLYQKGIDDLTISDQRTQGQSSVRMRAAPLQ